MADCYSIVVNVAGNAARRSDRLSTSEQAAAGQYEVLFPEDVDDWMWQATLGTAADSDQAADSATTELGEMGVNDTIRARTFNGGGAATDRPFHLSARRVRP
jgi:hypothetical protein